MVNMTVSVFVYWVLVFQLLLIVSIASTGNRQIDDREISGDLERIVDEKSILGLLHPSWINGQLTRGKRNEQVEDEAAPTRHARHRKRRRYRNRSTYLRNMSATRLPLLLNNDTIPIDQNSKKETKDDAGRNSRIVKVEEESRDRLGVNDGVQDSYNKTNMENDDVTDREKSEIDSKETAGNSSSVNYSVDERPSSTEIEFENVDESSRKKGRSKKHSFESTDYFDESDSSDIYSAIDDRVVFHESLSVLVSKLFQSLRNASTTDGQELLKQLNFVNGTNEDPCQKWLNSKDKLEQVFLDGLTSLPACPCLYPSNIFYDDKIWDEKRMKYFRWRDVSGSSQRLDVYKPGATYCVRSLLTQGSGSAAAQHCCYDHRRKLLTRGSGAGTPYFVSPEISPTLHERIDVLPWRLCKGDFSRYNGVRPPNNDNVCEANPDDEEYQRQIDDTKYY